MNEKDKIAKRVYGESYRKLCNDKKRIVLTIIKAGGMDSDRIKEVSKAGYSFLKILVALFYLLAIIFQIKWLVIFGFLIILLTIFIDLEKNPIILFYEYTIGYIIKSEKETLDKKAVNFANSMGAIFAFIAIIFLYFINALVGWVIVVLLIILKIASSLGFCGGVKIYNCMTNGCCVFKYTKKK